MSTASLVSLMPLCLDNKREKNQGLLPSQLNYARFYYCNMHTSFTDLCVYHTYTHSLPNSFSVFILSLFIDLYICVMCVCVCAHMRTDTCVTQCTCGGQKTTSASILTPPLYYTGFFLCCLWLCTTGSLAPEFGGFSYLGFPSHYSTGIADVQHCTQIYMVLKV